MLKIRNPAMAGQLGLRSGSGHELSREMAVFVAISGKPRAVIEGFHQVSGTVTVVYASMLEGWVWP